VRIHTLGIIGGGEMGSGIATVCALAGCEVAIVDLSPELLERSIDKVQRNLDILVEAHEITEQPATDARHRVRLAADLREGVGGAQLVVEAVPEDLGLKQRVLRDAEKAAAAETILATNASHLRTTEVTSACERPEKTCGIHFYNPPFVFRGVEVIKGERTSDETFEAAVAFVESIGSVPIRAFKDPPSMVLNRLQRAIRDAADRLIADGVTTREDIDNAALFGFGPKYATFGVLKAADLTSPTSGLRQSRTSGEGLYYEYEEYGVDEAFRRRDLALIQVVRAARQAREAYSL